MRAQRFSKTVTNSTVLREPKTGAQNPPNLDTAPFPAGHLVVESPHWRLTHQRYTSDLNVLPIRDAAFDGFELGEAAAFLLDEIVFDAAAVFGRLEDGGPLRHALAE